MGKWLYKALGTWCRKIVASVLGQLSLLTSFNQLTTFQFHKISISTFNFIHCGVHIVWIYSHPFESSPVKSGRRWLLRAVEEIQARRVRKTRQEWVAWTLMCGSRQPKDSGWLWRPNGGIRGMSWVHANLHEPARTQACKWQQRSQIIRNCAPTTSIRIKTTLSKSILQG